jgi:hypothetical protein
MDHSQLLHFRHGEAKLQPENPQPDYAAVQDSFGPALERVSRKPSLFELSTHPKL